MAVYRILSILLLFCSPRVTGPSGSSIDNLAKDYLSCESFFSRKHSACQTKLVFHVITGFKAPLKASKLHTLVRKLPA